MNFLSLLTILTTATAQVPVIPCAKASDFDGTVKYTSLTSCADIIGIDGYLPKSPSECNDIINGMTKANMLKKLYLLGCCKKGSDANEVCGFKPNGEIIICSPLFVFFSRSL